MSKHKNLHRSKITRNFFCTMSVLLLLSGCAGKDKIQNNIELSSSSEDFNLEPTLEPTEEKSIESREFSQIEQCAKELDALKTTNPHSYDKLHTQFDQMISTVNQYSKVRSSLKLQTQDTVQALYTYKVSRICNEIEQHLLDGLTDLVSLKNEGGHK